MPLACPQCKQFYERSGVCPLCNVVLLYHAPGLDSDPNVGSSEEDDAGQWQQTPWGKILIGLILAQGLSFGLLQLLKAGFLATGIDGSDPWETLLGLVLRHAIHAFSLIIGGALTGAGHCAASSTAHSSASPAASSRFSCAAIQQNRSIRF